MTTKPELAATTDDLQSQAAALSTKLETLKKLRQEESSQQRKKNVRYVFFTIIALIAIGAVVFISLKAYDTYATSPDQLNPKAAEVCRVLEVKDIVVGMEPHPSDPKTRTPVGSLTITNRSPYSATLSPQTGQNYEGIITGPIIKIDDEYKYINQWSLNPTYNGSTPRISLKPNESLIVHLSLGEWVFDSETYRIQTSTELRFRVNAVNGREYRNGSSYACPLITYPVKIDS